ncbi:hypothetical protein RIF29_24979 [Crotalaria pallida]|uniref:Uncharacterized protein n=1 Tax=Crotalaria pallida TaxID=3830 RepID=A0AAN9HYW6_CROPI
MGSWPNIALIFKRALVLKDRRLSRMTRSSKRTRGWSTNNRLPWLWRAKIPSKIQRIAWLVTKDAVPVNVMRFRQGLSLSAVILIDISCLLKKDWAVQVQQVLRETNYVVEGLAKWGSTHNGREIVWSSLPNFLALALQTDSSGVVHLR